MNLTFIHEALRLVQLFNVEKRWGFVDEAFKAINYDLRVDTQNWWPPAPTSSFREILYSPECPEELLKAGDMMFEKLSKGEVSEKFLQEEISQEKTPVEMMSGKEKNSKWKPKEKKSEERESNGKGKGKKPEGEGDELNEQSYLTIALDDLFAKANAQQENAVIALEKYQTILKEGIEMIQTHNTSISTDNFEPPPLPKSSEFRGITITSNQGLPRALRQGLIDLQFVGKRVRESVPKVEDLRERAYWTIEYWSSASKECWEYAKEHIYEMANMRQYEYYRTELAASYTLANNLQSKAVSWFFKSSSHIWTSDLAKALRIDGRSFAQIKEDL